MTTSPKPGRAQGGQGGNVSAGKVAEIRALVNKAPWIGADMVALSNGLPLLLAVVEAAQAFVDITHREHLTERWCAARQALDKALAALEES